MALATRHGKEGQIAPALLTVGLVTEVVAVDTDQFGTFTGEIARRGPAREVVIAKARAGLEASGFVRGVASEGTLGPYPELPALTYDLELVGFVDIESGVTVIEEALSFETTVASVRAWVNDDLGPFLHRVGFPAQGLIVRRGDGDRDPIIKGVVTPEQLRSAVAVVARSSRDRQVFIETDQRAHLCPTRRRVIQEAAQRLASRLSRPCPSCLRPGFGLVAHEPGLPCRDCGAPTDLDQAIIEGCSACGEQIRVPFVGGANPAQCSYCNP
ncbi:MAG: DUF6671 family protein [Ferrimicrobium sp.]|uniref:DUF6671 family protein n=1 Tax=Ferrimicrobium sp. TaxID=2926050 RepID=UPI00262329EC|nr:DUF6671 family protein [Ferrimicrobium sp.]